MTPESTAIDALACFRLTRLVVEDTFPPVLKVREWIHERWPPIGKALHADDGWTFVAGGREKLMMGHRWIRLAGLDRRVSVPVEAGVVIGDAPPDHAVALKAHPIGELFACPWCLSAYVAVGVVAARKVAPGVWDPVARALAYSAVAGIIASKT